MTIASGDTQREATALADSLTSQSENSHQQHEAVPVHVVQAIREELRAEKEKNETFRNHMQMMQWQQQQVQPQQPSNPFGNADPEDSIKVKDAMRYMSDMEQRTNAKLAEIQLAARTPDYKDVIQKYLPKAAQEDPDLLNDIKNSANPYKAAYQAAKSSNAYLADLAASQRGSSNQSQVKASRQDPDAERVIQNSKQSGNLASVGNNSNASGQHQDYGRMTDDEFRKIKAENLFRGRKK